VSEAVDRARRIAETLLLPDASAVDRADRIPAVHLAALDDAGLTGLAAAAPSLAERMAVTEALASGCLATAFVWLQHQGALAAVAQGPPAVRDRHLADLVSGRRRAGVAITALRPPAPLRVTREATVFRLDGRVPWVTGWGIAELLLVAALDADHVVHHLLVDVPGAGISGERLSLVAADASGTATITFAGAAVPADRLIGMEPLAEQRARDAAGLAGNGALALGVAARAIALSPDPGGLDGELDRTRASLLAAEPQELPAARAAASDLAVRAASRLVIGTGARSVLAGSAPERLLREAAFLLVFGSRPAIRAELLARQGVAAAR
jgi:alkylation response protein AidB-like acyl-CoA dehydrogenase